MNLNYFRTIQNVNNLGDTTVKKCDTEKRVHELNISTAIEKLYGPSSYSKIEKYMLHIKH